MVRTRKTMGSLAGRYFTLRYLCIYIVSFFVSYWFLWLTSYLQSSIAKVREETNEDLIPWGCNIPEMIANISRKPPWKASFFSTPECAKDRSMFKITPDSRLVRLNPGDPFWKVATCCYKNFWRVDTKPDFSMATSSKCYDINPQKTTIIKQYMDFLYIICNHVNTSEIIFTDRLPHVRYVQDLAYDDEFDRGGETEQLSVMIFGIQSMSRLEFARSLPNTRKYLKEELGAYEFLGYSALGQGPGQNIYPLLTGLQYKQFYNACSSSTDEDAKLYLDSCPFLWSSIAAQGFQTSFYEEHKGESLFSRGSNGSNWSQGFSSNPFSLDFRILNHALRNGTLGHNKGHPPSDQCYGPRLSLKSALTHFVSLAQAYRSNKLFHVTWTKSVGDLENSDELLLETLKELKYKSYLHQIALIFVSDDGSGPGVSKKHGASDQEYFETRLPLLYMVLPRWYREKYRKVAANLEKNTKRLTHAQNVFGTLWDLMGVPREEIEGEIDLEEKLEDLTLFSLIPKSKDCESAGISGLYCPCLQRVKLDTEGEEVKFAMGALLDQFNDRLKISNNNCSELKLKNIVSAHALMNTARTSNSNADAGDARSFLIAFTTAHVGEVLWEGAVMRSTEGLVLEEIRRVRSDPSVNLCMSPNGADPDCVCD